MKKSKKINSYFISIKNKEKMRAWLMRQYFNPKLHAEKPWYKRSVTQRNVLEYISNPLNKFPLTPINVARLWRITQSFKKNLKKAEKELGPDLGLSRREARKVERESAEALAKYQGGEATLREIGKVLGDVSATMINRLASTGMQKFRALTMDVSLEKMDEKDFNSIFENIVVIRKKAAREYADNLKASKGNIKWFINRYLIKNQIMTKLDAKLMEDIEIEGIALLAGKSKKQIIDILLFDIGRQNNLFKSFQSTVSRHAFPVKTRGRPRKKKS